jgi:hypothetical protein
LDVNGGDEWPELPVAIGVVTDMRVLRPTALLLAVLLSACGSQPGIAVSIGQQSIPMALSSTSRLTAWGSGEHGDAFPREIPVTTVRTSLPMMLKFEAGQGASAIRGWLYDKEAPTANGGPSEEFNLPGRTGAYAPRTIVAGRTYEIVVNVMWSGVLVSGEQTHLFRVKVEAP